jgi:hypothetical protein
LCSAEKLKPAVIQRLASSFSGSIYLDSFQSLLLHAALNISMRLSHFSKNFKSPNSTPLQSAPCLVGSKTVSGWEYIGHWPREKNEYSG